MNHNYCYSINEDIQNVVVMILLVQSIVGVSYITRTHTLNRM